MQGQLVYIRPLAIGDSEALHALRNRNRSFFEPFEPIRPASYFTLEQQRAMIEWSIKAAGEDQSYVFGVFLQETAGLIGRIELSGIARGPFQNANLGYFMDQAHNGRGYMSEAIALVLQYAFLVLRLHRIQAGVMPRNFPSIRVLTKAGFRYEGLAKKYLQINGIWEDHALYAITVEDYTERTAASNEVSDHKFS
ncbi:GNAT family N-acetyltransferase [Paenibacillus sinopodophylli]|uniref:GNAT family N-acetyltransferase n=1 Tax=Paenibacillus sinopodophylli TaxID=1837342 RepID=UPI00110D0D2A|nr:GNAT family protein [Paenibacillus sinopodophylli]